MRHIHRNRHQNYFVNVNCQSYMILNCKFMAYLLYYAKRTNIIVNGPFQTICFTNWNEGRVLRMLRSEKWPYLSQSENYRQPVICSPNIWPFDHEEILSMSIIARFHFRDKIRKGHSNLSTIFEASDKFQGFQVQSYGTKSYNDVMIFLKLNWIIFLVRYHLENRHCL